MQINQKNTFFKNQMESQLKRNYVRNLFCLLLMMVTLVSCKSSKNAVSTEVSSSPDAVKTEKRIVELINLNRQTTRVMTSKMNLQLVSGSKKMSVGGNLRMKRDDVIQITLSALGLFDLGCMELTPDYLLVVDRVDHQYIKVEYKEVDFLKKAGIDFYVFQSLFWDELFLAGDRGAVPAAKKYQKTLKGDDLKLVNSDARQMVLTFMADVASGMVRSTSFSSKERADQPVLDWQYEDYTKLNRQSFPSRMQIRINASSKPLAATISLSHLKVSDDWEKRTQLGKRYTPITVESAFNSIMRLAK